MTSNNLVDPPILDVTSRNDDTIILLDDNSPSNNIIRIPAISGLRLFVFIEFLVLLIIWLTGMSLLFLSINQANHFVGC